jgi:hypothetical protein
MTYEIKGMKKSDWFYPYLGWVSLDGNVQLAVCKLLGHFTCNDYAVIFKMKNDRFGVSVIIHGDEAPTMEAMMEASLFIVRYFLMHIILGMTFTAPLEINVEQNKLCEEFLTVELYKYVGNGIKILQESIKSIEYIYYERTSEKEAELDAMLRMVNYNIEVIFYSYVDLEKFSLSKKYAELYAFSEKNGDLRIIFNPVMFKYRHIFDGKVLIERSN